MGFGIQRWINQGLSKSSHSNRGNKHIIIVQWVNSKVECSENLTLDSKRPPMLARASWRRWHLRRILKVEILAKWIWRRDKQGKRSNMPSPSSHANIINIVSEVPSIKQGRKDWIGVQRSSCKQQRAVTA